VKTENEHKYGQKTAKKQLKNKEKRNHKK